jgi:hypothetical protein
MMASQSFTIRSSRVFLGVLGVAVAAIGLGATYLPLDGSVRGAFFKYLGTPFLFAISPLLLWGVIRPPVIRIDSEGFTLDGGLRRKSSRIGWRDIEAFVMYAPYPGATMAALRRQVWVGYKMIPRHPVTAMTPPIDCLISTVDGSLGGGWPIEPKALVEFMENCRRNALALDAKTAAPRSG